MKKMSISTQLIVLGTLRTQTDANSYNKVGQFSFSFVFGGGWKGNEIEH